MDGRLPCFAGYWIFLALSQRKGVLLRGGDLVETHTPLQDLRGPYGTGKQVPSSIC